MNPPNKTPTESQPRVGHRLWIGATLFCAMVVVGAAYSWFVWPTPYRYDHIDLQGMVYPVRIHRITDRTELLSRNGWIELGSPQERVNEHLPQREIDAPPDVLAKLQGRASIDSFGQLTCDVYNGSNWKITKLYVDVDVRNADGTSVYGWRRYEVPLRSGETGLPLKTSAFGEKTGIRLEGAQTWAWSLWGAKGNWSPE